MKKGYLALVLHAHLPYVHHPESEDYIEERWLFEAMTETYLPLLEVFEGLVRDGVNFRVTMSLTPTLLTMLDSALLQQRYIAYLDNLIVLAGKEVERTRGNEELAPLAAMYKDKFTMFKQRFIENYERSLINGFRKMQDTGCVEFITCAVTHAFLPYVKTEQSLRAQIDNAVKIHTSYMGRRPNGIWLPECGYKEGLDRILKDYRIRFFFTETHGLLHADPKPADGVYAPVYTPEGVAAFARDMESSKQVWSSLDGYPGDYDYREYYRDIGYELDYEYIKPHLHRSGIRLNTGIKYYRITGGNEHKDIYKPQWARNKAANHAGNFMFNREKQIEHLADRMDRKPIVTASYDSELFGHWWYEGPMWIDYLCRKIHYDQDVMAMVTPTEYLQEYPDLEQCCLSMSSWGRGGYGEVWLGEANGWVYRHLHRMEERMIALADRFASGASELEQRALNQAARELLLAQSSDWAFIIDNRTMVDYAVKRTKQHVARFSRLYDALMSARDIDQRWLEDIEGRDAICPEIDYRLFRTRRDDVAGKANPIKVLMLSWEFPPMTVGGLSRHVYDLSVKLAEQGVEVHVVTCHVDGYPAYEINRGVHVHRVKTYQTRELHFMDWVFQLNLAMIDYCKPLIRNYGPFHMIHAHDWLVGCASKALKHRFEIPLVATIHATEHGRNRGIHNELQQSIHQMERELTYEAWRVIGCSKYMEEEIKSLFDVPEDKLHIIPNGVDRSLFISAERNDESFRARYALPHEKIVFFVGRLVREKGVHILLDSVPAILERCPDAKFVIAGKGPMLEELQNQARQTGVESKVVFPGFIDDDMRNKLFAMSSAAVFPSLYEPFGIVALEAMAARVPVIVSGTGGLQEIVRYGVDGFTVIPGDVPSLVTHITKILQEEELAQSMVAKASHKVSAVYDWGGIASRTREVYGEILACAQENRG
jgi:1,4-alpha-glucan branching enzyme